MQSTHESYRQRDSTEIIYVVEPDAAILGDLATFLNFFGVPTLNAWPHLSRYIDQAAIAMMPPLHT